jgi:hypothetical protein
MPITLNERFIAYLTLLMGLTISGVAVYYSVIGLTAIFAAAALPVIIMGTTLEVSKLVATLWLKQYWKSAPFLIKTYLIVAITVLMFITSMGIFGFLSKAHLDQTAPTGDVAAQIELVDIKIKAQRDNIEASQKVLVQMDKAVDEVLARSKTEQGARNAANLRRQQAKERSQLTDEVGKAQKEIAVLNEERALVSKELRAVEAEVGPIKYIAALIYGEDTEANSLEKAVSWLIIILVAVFDPLAVVLLLASQVSFQNFRERKNALQQTTVIPPAVTDDSSPIQEEPSAKKFDNDPITSEPQINQWQQEVLKQISALEINTEDYTNNPKTAVDDLVQYYVNLAIEIKEQEEKEKSSKEFDRQQNYVTLINALESSVKELHDERDSLHQEISRLNSAYVQNEEQKESGRWNTLSKITEEEYIEKSKKKNDNSNKSS